MEQQVKLSWLDWWSLGLGLGDIPQLQGASSCIIGIILVFPTSHMNKSLAIFWILSWTILSFVSCCATYRKLEESGRKKIVCDEVVGMMFTFMFIPLSIKRVFWGFIVFKLLNILKPGPIAVVENKSYGYIGIMAGSILAGLASFSVLGLMI